MNKEKGIEEINYYVRFIRIYHCNVFWIDSGRPWDI